MDCIQMILICSFAVSIYAYAETARLLPSKL